ncbi:DUF6221 family protein (plasmid) [Streptomyces anulatus]|uniref:DUF6221 family protein n=1 Tax=Streptomyces anulatus TaxID=1892 RepID=UPI00324F6F5F
MTAQGEDILAYLDRVITRVETAARATTDHQPYDQWDAVGDDRDTATARMHWEVLKVARMHPTPAARDLAQHIALHDPESVLRRCAADRKLIAEHGPCSDQDLGCKGCGFNNQEESMVDHYEDCPVLCALAEGYGWTEGER